MEMPSRAKDIRDKDEEVEETLQRAENSGREALSSAYCRGVMDFSSGVLRRMIFIPTPIVAKEKKSQTRESLGLPMELTAGFLAK